MQGPDFLYFFIDSITGKSYYVENGIVKTSAIGVPINFTPVGWKDILIDNIRNQKYFALDRSFSIPINAVEDGAFILKTRYHIDGTEAKVSVVILEQKLFYDGASYGFYYDSFYRGDIDFSNYVHTGPIVTVNIMEAGIVRNIKARENQKINIPIDVPEAVLIQADGIKLHSTKNFIVINPQYPHAVTGAFGTKEQLVMRDLSQEGYFFNIGFETETGNLVDQTVSYLQGKVLADLDYFNARVSNTVQFTTRMKGTIIETQGRSSVRVGFDVKIERIDGTLETIFSINHNFSADPTDNKWAFDVTGPLITMNPGDRFFVWQVPNANQNSNFWGYDEDVTFSYNVIDRNKTTYVKALKPGYVLQQILNFINDGNVVAFQSDLLSDKENYRKLLTSGDAVRGLSGSNIPTSLSDFMQSEIPQYDGAFGLVNGILRFEPKSFFVDYSDPIDMGEVAKLTHRPYKEQLHSSIIIGYPNQNYNDVNGKYEFNNVASYTTPITSDSKELNLVGVYRADGFGFEYVRANFAGINTTDSKNDNDVFIVDCLPDPIDIAGVGSVYVLDRTLNAGATGVPEPDTIMNVRISPARLVRIMGKYIGSGFYKANSKYLKYLRSEKNEFLYAGGIRENDDIQIGSLGIPYYTANTLSFSAPCPSDLVNILALNSARSFKFTYLGLTLLVIPNKIGIKASDNEEQEHIFLSAYQNDLSKLVNIFD